MSYSAQPRSHGGASSPEAHGSGVWAGRDPQTATSGQAATKTHTPDRYRAAYPPEPGQTPIGPPEEPVPTKLDLCVQHHGDRATVQVGGEVDLATCPQLHAVLVELADRGFHYLVVDLEQVSFLDCAGIRVLVDARRRVQQHSGFVKLVRPRPLVWRVLELTGMTTVFPIHTSLREALATEPV
jgi:anti-sigma B factor antagonist